MKATLVLHNLLQRRKEHPVGGPDSKPMLALQQQPAIDEEIIAGAEKAVRDKFCNYYNNQGRVSWQEKMINDTDA